MGSIIRLEVQDDKRIGASSWPSRGSCVIRNHQTGAGRQIGMMRDRLLIAVAFALLLAACGTDQVEVAGTVGSTTTTRAEISLAAACAQFSVAYSDDGSGDVPSALLVVADVIVADYPEAAAGVLAVADRYADETEPALAGLAILDPILSDDPACHEMHEIVSGWYAPTVALDTIAADLAEARDRWEAAGITTYHYEAWLSIERHDDLPSSCGAGRVVVQITDGAPAEAHDRMNSCEIDLDNPERVPLTIEKIFDFIEAMIADGDLLIWEADAEFHADGWPTTFFVASDATSVEIAIDEIVPGILDTPEADQILVELENARAKWEAATINSYRFRVLVGCFCPEEVRGPFEVTVRDGEVVEATRDGGELADYSPDQYFTILGLFDAVEALAHSDRLDVTYHAEYGYPILIDADLVFRAIDEERTIEVLEFEILDG